MTEIQLYNARTRTKEPFRPIDPDNVRMYVCGPTVYDRAHIGNARPVVVFDVLFRLLRQVYGADHVTYVRNFTDVDDKINARAAATGRPIRDITDETIGWYHEDMDALGALRPTFEPRATDHIPDMIAMIERLVASGHAYVAEGHVLFDVGSYPDYGKLARRSLDEMQAGARVEVAPYKRSPMDFVLWKPSEGDLPGWDSPWGHGRPGWHLECSAMSDELLWEKPFKEGRLSAEALKHPHVFDIHGGGIDLAFPHHENEVAQSCCANHTEVMANVWMHNEFLQVEGEKMAKSLGNFFTVKDLLNRPMPGEVIRWLLLKTHYRKPLNWTEDGLAAAWTELLGLLDFPAGLAGHGTSMDSGVVETLSDDLNFPAAIGRLHVLRQNRDFENLASTMNVLGFSGRWMDVGMVVNDLIDRLLQERANARKNKDFDRADAIRDAFISAGVEVRDTPKGPEWSLLPNFDPSRLEAL